MEKGRKISNRIKNKKENILKLSTKDLELKDIKIELNTFIEKFQKSRSRGSALLNNLDLFSKIISRTKYIQTDDIFKNVAERVYQIQNDLFEVPKCKCGRDLKFRINGYSKFCSTICSNRETYKTRKKRIKLVKTTGTCRHPNCENLVFNNDIFCSKGCQIRFQNTGVSIDSQILFETLALGLSIKMDSFYFLNFGERFIDKKYYVDFLYENKIIEYNGDIWHSNPLIFSENEISNPRAKIKAKEVWEKDKKRIDYLKSKGFDILIVWEKEWKENPEKILKDCSKFLGFNKKDFEIISIQRLKKQKEKKEVRTRIRGEWLKGKTYEEIYGNKRGKDLRKIRSGKNNPASMKRKIIFPDMSEYIIEGNFEIYCKDVLKINPSTFRYHVKKGNKYKGFYFVNLKELKKC